MYFSFWAELPFKCMYTFTFITKLQCFRAHCVLAVWTFKSRDRLAAGRNEAELGKVTAPQCCCLDPRGLVLWTDHCVFTALQLSVCVCVCVCVRVCI